MIRPTKVSRPKYVFFRSAGTKAASMAGSTNGCNAFHMKESPPQYAFTTSNEAGAGFCNAALELEFRAWLALYGERSRAVLSMIASTSATRPAGVFDRNMASKPSPIMMRTWRQEASCGCPQPSG